MSFDTRRAALARAAGTVSQGRGAGSIFSILHAILGFQPAAPREHLYVDPGLPDSMPDLIPRDLRVGARPFDIRFARAGERTSFEMLRGDKDHVVRCPMTAWADALCSG